MCLTNKQTVFIAEYLKDFNATQAAIRAGYSANTARVIGPENLSKPDIAKEISRLVAEKSMGKDEVLLRLADIGRGDIAELMDITSQGFTIELMRDGKVIPQTKLIKKVKQKVTTFSPQNGIGEDREVIETEIELYSQLEALQTLAKIHGIMTDKQELSGTVEIIFKETDATGN